MSRPSIEVSSFPNISVDIASDVFIGILSGLVATLITYLSVILYKKIFEPWLEDRLYRGPTIQGRWIAKVTTIGIEREVAWQIIQTAHRINATAVPLSGPNKGKNFRMNGTFYNLILTLTYATEFRDELERGCIAVKLSSNGRKMEGHILYFNGRVEKIGSSEYTMERYKLARISSLTGRLKALKKILISRAFFRLPRK